MNSRYINPHAPYQQQQQPVYQQPAMMPQQQPQPVQTGGVQIAMNANGQYVYVDTSTGQIVGFVQNPQPPQQVAMARPVGMQQGVMMLPQQQQRFGAAQNASAGMIQPGQQFAQAFAPGEDLPSNSRYGNIQQLTQQPQQERIPVIPQYQPQSQAPQLQAPQLMRPVAAAIKQEVVNVPPPVRVVPPVVAPKSPDSRKGISDSKVKLEVRAMPFTDKDVNTESDTATELSESFDQLVADLAKTAQLDTGLTTVYVRNTITAVWYHGVSVADKEQLLFQGDVEAVYRALHGICPDVTSKKELCYYNAFVDWVTEAINDYLLVATKGEVLIDSFYDDFNDLFRHLTSNKPVLEGLMSSVNDMLEQAAVDISAIRGSEEGGEKGEVDETAVIPKRKMVVYVKMLSEEIGMNGTPEGEKSASRLIQTLKPYVDTEIFHLATLDKGLYKAYFRGDGDVVLDRLA